MRRFCAIACLLVLTYGCSVEPWVKPYERDRLADPIMSFDRDPVSSAYIHHVYEAREGSRGVVGTLAVRISPAPSSRTRSVKVPPVSTPTTEPSVGPSMGPSLGSGERGEAKAAAVYGFPQARSLGGPSTRDTRRG